MSATVTIKFRHGDGEPVAVQARAGISVMEAAVMNNISGIEAECGGSCICATCHVYCDDLDNGVLPEMSSEEDDMLDMASAERRAGSRLCCQLRVSDKLDGALFTIPESQF